VEITGEAYFEIAHDASKPFIVAVNGTEIKVLGTKFNVNAYADEGPIRTTLLEGSVQVKKGIEHTTIKPGQQAQVANNTIKTIDHADVEQAVAWKNGFFNFDGQDIPTALRQIARWYSIDVVYEDEIPKDKFMGEVERNLSLSQALKIMERAGLQFTVEGRKLIVKQQ
jgi:ferric-dicitrate binding protein FerR (iron transport regulator)